MSLSLVRPYFRGVLDSLGYIEYKDGFDFENIPDTIIDNNYNVQSGVTTLLNQTLAINDLNTEVSLNVFIKGFRDPTTAIDDAMTKADQIITECTKVITSNGAGVKNVSLSSFETIPKSTNNDNILILSFIFNVRLILSRL